MTYIHQVIKVRDNLGQLVRNKAPETHPYSPDLQVCSFHASARRAGHTVHGVTDAVAFAGMAVSSLWLR